MRGNHRIGSSQPEANGYIRQNKTGNIVFVPEHGHLTKVLDATPKVATVVVTSKSGRGYSENGLRSSFQQLRVRLESEGKIDPGLTFHGLRHTVATKPADAGADAEAIVAVEPDPSHTLPVERLVPGKSRLRARK